MDENVSWFIEKKVQRTIENLAKHNIGGLYVENEAELIKKLGELIPHNATVGVGDSMTLFETGVIEFLRNGKYNFLDKYGKGLSSEDRRNIYRKSFSADVFMCSTNAVTEKGELYNIDGNGSRVAAMLYGPDKVIIVAGINKIVQNLEEAEKRVRSYAAPIDARRLHKDTPCTKLGYCVDCSSKDRICNDFVIIRGQFNKDRITVIFVGRQLGY